MDFLSAIILGTVQGLTEFLPISSSGHLVLARLWLPATPYDLAFDALLHFATAAAIIIYFRTDFWRLLQSSWNLLQRREVARLQRAYIYALILGTIPAVLLGLLLEREMETIFRNPALVAGTLIAGSAVMYSAERFARKEQELSAKSGFRIGLFQSLALIPGMSRSGMAISGGLFFGLSREEAARFAFMLGAPLLIGAGAKKALDLFWGGALFAEFLPIALGMSAAFITGLFAIHFLLRFLRTNTLGIFILYRLALAAVVLLIL